LKRKADISDKLDMPHRWANGSEALGRWILEARNALASRGQIDLRGTLPRGVTLIVAENSSRKPRTGYSLAGSERKPIDALVNNANTVLVLATQNDTVDALRAFFSRRLLIWEGHVRENLSVLVGAMQNHKGDAANITQAVVTFLNEVATGFSPSAYGNTLLAEVSDGCVARRSKKPATLQTLGRMVLEQPDHKGVANLLRRLSELRMVDPAFKTVKVDYNREFWDAIRLGDFDDANVGLAELSRRRTYIRPSLPTKAISTVHKAKGLESDNVLIMPCDGNHFGDSQAARCRLYVAMSRSIRSLTFVVSRQDPSPLVLL
jgi:DNA helicase-2/ATP-dependent DNA helicase PcrA